MAAKYSFLETAGICFGDTWNLEYGLAFGKFTKPKKINGRLTGANALGRPAVHYFAQTDCVSVLLIIGEEEGYNLTQVRFNSDYPLSKKSLTQQNNRGFVALGGDGRRAVGARFGMLPGKCARQFFSDIELTFLG